MVIFLINFLTLLMISPVGCLVARILRWLDQVQRCTPATLLTGCRFRV